MLEEQKKVRSTLEETLEELIGIRFTFLAKKFQLVVFPVTEFDSVTLCSDMSLGYLE